ncbi:MAG TPA: fibronectin type III domain-containing protein [Streptosporangiaceae bacterium]
MATPPIVPAGWYTDPVGRHEYRYWDGTDWKPEVSDGGVTAVDPLGPAPPPLAQRTAEPAVTDPAVPAPVSDPAAPTQVTDSAAPAPVTNSVAPAAPAGAPRRRRKWTIPLVAIATVAVIGLIAGLVIWAPWQSPPLLRPAGLGAGPSTTSSVAFHWAGPATGPPPDKYLILNDGKVIGSVPGTVTSYRGTGLAPATAYQFRVAAVRGGKRSALSSVLVVATSRPPVSAARLDGRWTVGVKIVQGASGLRGIPKSHSWDESWRFSPSCAAGPCAVRLVGHFGRLRFKTTLARAGAVYGGKTVGNVFPCGSGSNSFPIRSTLRIRIRVKTAQVAGRAWSAGSWSGTMGIAAPYTSSGAFYCPASHQKASLSASS